MELIVLILSVAVTGFTQAFKMSGVNTKYLPWIAVVIGLFLGSGLGYTLSSGDVQTTIFATIAGGLYGLVVTGCVDRVDHVIDKLKNK